MTIPLQSYFRLNAPGAGQFEHTLIIVDEGAYLHFIEGCSAPKYNVANLHAGCVELFVGKNAKLRYSTIENWSKNMYNLNTKRALVEEGGTIEWVSGSFGSHVSYLYPMSVLNGKGARAEFTGITFAGAGQNLDTGTKVVHNAPETTSYINTKSISKDGGISTFRSSVVVKNSAAKSKSAVSCQSLMLDDFQFGPLDQGWWPDGLYTAPTDEALLYDIQKTKDFGYNMIRKHIKVEPARWYTYCDQLGIIVWQDMPSGDRNPQWQNRKYFDGTEMKRSAESEAYYRKEWKEIMDCLYSYPCIGTWVPFNEAWGQFKTVEIAEWTKQYDPTRLVNPASGGNHYTCGDMLDLHNYPAPEMYLYDAQRATVLGEYGGIGLVLKDHIWEPNRNWGYVQFNSSKEATDEYVKYASNT